MMKVQQDNVDSYLEDIVMRAGERAADQEARQEIKEHAAAIDRIADEVDKRFVRYTSPTLTLFVLTFNIFTKLELGRSICS